MRKESSEKSVKGRERERAREPEQRGGMLTKLGTRIVVQYRFFSFRSASSNERRSQPTDRMLLDTR